MDAEIGIASRLTPPDGILVPTLVDSDQSWIQISAGYRHSFALSQEGSWFAWGDNRVGQSGVDFLNLVRLPNQVGSETGWLAVQAGGVHGLAIGSEGVIRALGGNEFSQLGDGTTSNRIEPVEVFLQSVNEEPPSVVRNPRSRVVESGSSLTLSVEAEGTEPLTFQWRRNGIEIPGATDDFLDLTNIGENQQGSYDVVIRNQLGSVTSSSAEVRVLGVPRLTQIPQSLDAAVGGRAVFSVVVDPRDVALGGLEFQWFHDGEPVSVSQNILGAQSATLALTRIQSSMAGEYQVRVTGPGGEVLSDPAILSVVTAPVITNPPARQLKVLQGGNLELSVSAVGSEPLQYEWFFNSEVIPGATAATLRVESVDIVNEGTYRVRVSNGLGVASSSPSQVIVESPPVITQSFGNVVAKRGDPVTLRVEVTAKPDPLIIWKRNGVTIQGSSGNELTIPSVGDRHQGIYTVQAINPVGSDTVNGTIIVSEAPRILVPPRGGFAANGGSARLAVTAVSNLPLIYEWFINDSAIPNSDTPRPIIQNISQDDTGNYLVEVSNQVGTTRSSPAALLPVDISKFPQTVNPGEDVTIAVDPLNNPGPLEYTWRLNGKKIEDGSADPSLTIEEVEMADAGLYSVTITDGTLTSTLFADELRVNAPAISLQDQFEDSELLQTEEGEALRVGDNIGATRQTGEPEHAGVSGAHSVWFSWEAPANGYVEIETEGSSIDTRLAAYTGSAVEALSEVASDDDTDSDISSEILFGVQSGTTYHIAIDSPRGQEGRIAIELEFTETELIPLTIASQPAEQRVQAGQNAQFMVQAEGQGDLTYQWFLNGLAIDGATGTMWNFANTSTNTVGTYFVTVTDPGTGLIITSEPASLYISESELNGTPVAESPLGSPEFKFNIAQNNVQNQSARSQLGARSDSFPRGGAPVSGFTNRQIYNTFGATTESNEPDHCGVPGGASQWTIFTPPFDGTVVMDTNGSDFDTVLAVYTSLTASFDDLVEIACDNNSGTDGLDSRLQFEGSASLTYFVVIDGVDGATGVAVMNTNVSPLLGATVTPTVLSAQEGDSAQFEVTFETPQEGVSVRWRKNGELIEGENSLTLNLASVSQADAGEYEAVITDSIGAETLATAGTLDILAPPTIVSQPESLSVFEGSAASFSVTAVSDGDLSYQWHFNGAPVDVAPNGPDWQIDPVNSDVAGEYFVEVAGTGGVRRSEVVNLNILEPTRIQTPPFSSVAPVGSEVVLSVEATGTSPLDYSWIFNGDTLPGANEPTLTLSSLSNDEAGEYRARVSGPGGDVESAPVSVTILPLPVIQQQPQGVTGFVGELVTLQVTATGGEPHNYQWYKNDQPIPEADDDFLTLADLKLSDSGDYRVEVSNDAGVVVSDTAQVVVLTESGDPIEISEIIPQIAAPDEHPTVTLKFNSVPGSTYELDVSFNLADWNNSLLQFTADSSESEWSFTEGVEFTEVSSPGSARFYRLRQLNP